MEESQHVPIKHSREREELASPGAAVPLLNVPLGCGQGDGVTQAQGISGMRDSRCALSLWC